MKVELSDVQVEELRLLLDGALAELSHEIADTDNPEYREVLRERRTVLESVLFQLDNPPRVSE